MPVAIASPTEENAATSTQAIAPIVAPTTGSRSVMATNTASAAANGTPMMVSAMNAPTPAMIETTMFPDTYPPTFVTASSNRLRYRMRCSGCIRPELSVRSRGSANMK